MERTEHLLKSLYCISPITIPYSVLRFQEALSELVEPPFEPIMDFSLYLFPLKFISFLMAATFCQMSKALQFFLPFAPFTTFQKDCGGCMTASQIFPGVISDFFSISSFN